MSGRLVNSLIAAWIAAFQEPSSAGSAEPVAVEGDAAVVRVSVNYGGDSPQEYTDLWVMHFAADGRVDDFEEWAYWPDKPYTAQEA